jgi:hypothetical protein
MVLLSVWLTACTGPLYNVAPIPKVPSRGEVAVIEAGLEIGAALVTEDRAFKDFDANLPLAGVVCIDLRVGNRSQKPFRPDIRLRTNGREWKPVSPKQALSRVMKHYGVTLYGKESFRQTREAYNNVGFHLDNEIKPGEERRGILFFDLKQPATNINSVVIEIKGADKPILLTIDQTTNQTTN